MSVLTDDPRVWIGCLASYNAGRLIGEWCEATDLEAMEECRDRVAQAAIAAAKDAGEYPVYFGDPEEFALFDYDGFPAQLTKRWGEYPQWETVADIGGAIACATAEDPEAFAAFLRFADYCGVDLDADNIRNWQEYLRGSGYDNEADYAYDNQYAVFGCEPAPRITSYIDWNSVARNEFFQHGTHYLVDGYVFDAEAR